MIVTGFHGIWESYKHPDFRQILNSADLWVPDGIAPVWVARLKGIKNARRTPGAEIMRSFLEQADKNGFSSFFYGDTDETLINLEKTLQEKYPNHKTAGRFSPPFRPLTPDEDTMIINMINNARPDVLWVGLGLPKQDRWIYERKDRLNIPVAIGVGIAFRFLSGDEKRVPAFIGENGLEWLWRFLKAPKKLWKRDLVEGPQFVVHVLMELMGIKKDRDEKSIMAGRG